MKIEIITLPSAKNRQERMQKLFNEFNLSFTFKNGISQDECSFENIYGLWYINCKNRKFLINEPKILKYTNRVWMRFGEIAAYLAHYFLWKDFLNTEEPYLIICEDDAKPQSNLLKLEQLFLSNNDVCFLNLQAVTAHNQSKLPGYNVPYVNVISPELVEYINTPQLPLLCEGLAAYAINKNGAKILTDYVENNGYVGPNDCMLAHVVKENILKIHSPKNIEEYFLLDEQTYEQSYTHSGEFELLHNFNTTYINKPKSTI